MKKIRKHLKTITIIFVMIMIISGCFIKYFLLNNKNEIVENDKEVSNEELIKEEKVSESIIKEEKNDQIKTVYVDIKGAVNNPGVYEIEETKKVIDVVELAGGLTGQADTSLINLAKKVSNEMVIIIYTVDEVKKAKQENTVIKIVEKECVCPEIKNDACLKQEDSIDNIINKDDDDNKDNTDTEDLIININEATKEEFMNLSGIGESKAEAIISYREENGKFKKIEDIKNVPGIGETLYEQIKNSITV